MPIAPTYPGVYVEEVPSGVHPITGVPTAVGAFIGWFPKGTMNAAVQLLSFADVEREYGGLHKDSDTSFALAQFFLNGGGRAWGVRVAAPGTGSNALNQAAANITGSGGGDAFVVQALNEGAWGNAIRVQVIGPGSDDRFDLLVMLTGTQGGRTTVLQQERFRGLTAVTATDPGYLPLAVNGVSRLVTVQPVQGGDYSTPAGSGITSTAAVNSLASQETRQVDVTVGGTTRTVDLPGTALSSGADIAAALQSAIRTAKGGDPVWAQAVVVSLDNGKLQVLSGVGDSADVGIASTSTGAGTDSTAADLSFSGVTASSGSFALAGGGDGAHPGASEIVGSEALGTGMHALENTDFTLLCLPSIANQQSADADGLPSGTGYPTITGSAIAYCREKRALLLLDPPDTATSTTAIQTWLAGNSSVRDEYSALYYPRVTVADPTRNYQPRSIGPCGTIAGLMARVDTARGVWKAPAGTEATLLGLQKLDDDLTDPQNGVLNPLAINCLRTFSAYGQVAWGARTLAGADAASSDYKYVPVRRLANFLESSLRIGLKWVVFEPNDEPLWSQIRLNVGSFLQGLFQQGAFAGLAPRDAYIVKCDRSTTTPDDQAKGVVNVLVGFAPLRPAEFVILRVQQLAGQTQS